MSSYGKTFDTKVVLGHSTKVVLGHCDLISWFSDFALYLAGQLVYIHLFFRL